jgi:hypothetical protein
MINSEMHAPFAAKVRTRLLDACVQPLLRMPWHTAPELTVVVLLLLLLLQDACTCLKRRLQMDHPQKQYLAIILTSKVGAHTAVEVAAVLVSQQRCSASSRSWLAASVCACYLAVIAAAVTTVHAQHIFVHLSCYAAASVPDTTKMHLCHALLRLHYLQPSAESCLA